MYDLNVFRGYFGPKFARKMTGRDFAILYSKKRNPSIFYYYKKMHTNKCAIKSWRKK
jgi:hypothetical protein